MWFVDKFHYSGHVNCSAGFDLRSYRRLKGFNSQASEQINSRLVRLKRIVSFMTQKNFMFFVRNFIMRENKNTNKNIIEKAETHEGYRKTLLFVNKTLIIFR